MNLLALALLLVLAPVVSSASGPSKGGSAQPATKGAPAPTRAETVTLTIAPRYLRDNPGTNTIMFEPDSDRRRASYTKYHFDRAAFLSAVGGALPSESFTAVIQIDKTTHENTSGAKGGNSPVGGFNLTHHTARLVSTQGLESRPAAQPAKACTKETGAKRSLTLVNNHSFPVEIHWMNEACEAKLIRAVPGGQRATLSTFNGHVFLLRNANTGEVRSKLTVSPKGGDNVVIR